MWLELPELVPELASELAPELGPELAPELGSELAPELGPELAPELGSELRPELGSLDEAGAVGTYLNSATLVSTSSVSVMVIWASPSTV